jgi:hypothetical protein
LRDEAFKPGGDSTFAGSAAIKDRLDDAAPVSPRHAEHSALKANLAN